jgi:galactosyl transferase GMA12/MNN10 family
VSGDPPRPRGRRALVSIGAGRQRALLTVAKRTFSPYARRYGYDLLLTTHKPQMDRPLPWAKIVLLREALRRYELALWLDADLMIVDHALDIATELEPGRFLYLVEHRYNGFRMPNSGVMLIRAGDQAEAFLEEVWNQPQFIHHRWWENAAICHVLGYDLDPPSPRRGTPFLAGTKLLSPRWNSVPDAPAVEPRIRHYPGYSLKARLAFMVRDLLLMRVQGLRGDPRSR